MFFQEQISKFGKTNYEKAFKYCFFLKDPLSFFNRSGYSEKERIEELNNNLKFKFDFTEHKQTFDWLVKYNCTRLEKSLERLFSDLSDYQIMMNDWEWTPGDDSRDPRAANKKIATAKAYTSFYEQILDLEARIKSENIDTGVGRSGYENSQSEKLAEKYKNGR